MNIRWLVCSASLLFTGACGDEVMLNDGADDSDVVIRAHLAPDESCKLDTKSRVVSRGTFDIKGAARGCARGYDLNLLVDNGSAYDIVFDEAEVKLTTHMDQLIGFGVPGGRDALPNPFMSRAVAPVASKALDVVTVQVISPAYAPFLHEFSGGELVAVVELRGKNDAGASVTSRTLTFPIDICEECLTVCTSEVPEGMSLDDIYGTECRDDAAADDRVCVSDCDSRP